MTNMKTVLKKLPVIGVMGSGREAHEKYAIPLGQWIARHDYHLLTGGGGGVMEAVARAFISVMPRAGLSIGIIPGRPGKSDYHPPVGYPNPYIELPVYTHLPDSGRKGTHPLSRNHINILSSDLLVFLPGGAGTHSELELARRYGKPHICFGTTSIKAAHHALSHEELFRLIPELLPAG